jgi:hypothetical protein
MTENWLKGKVDCGILFVPNEPVEGQEITGSFYEDTYRRIATTPLEKVKFLETATFDIYEVETKTCRYKVFVRK